MKSTFRPVEEVIPAPTSEVALAGRVMLHRSFGKICFATINDGTGKIQILFSRENCSINILGELKTELQFKEPTPHTVGNQVDGYKSELHY